MAIDAALLEFVGGGKMPILRFYSWTEPAASFGYFQDYEQIKQLTSLRPLVRRPTGGGLVPHDADWTYSVVFPPSHWWYALSAAESYRKIHEWLHESFELLGLRTEVAPEEKKLARGQCFVGHEKSDLLREGSKIAGAAQRRSRAGLLIQGSVQPPAGARRRADWEAAMREVAEKFLAVDWRMFEPNEDFLQRAAQLSREIYSHPDLRRGRNP